MPYVFLSVAFINLIVWSMDLKEKEDVGKMNKTCLVSQLANIFREPTQEDIRRLARWTNCLLKKKNKKLAHRFWSFIRNFDKHPRKPHIFQNAVQKPPCFYLIKEKNVIWVCTLFVCIWIVPLKSSLESKPYITS